ncbi:MAG: tRNA (adenosine(37)-N6)-dimethylallyltransferase MiaA [Pseudomonadota bacterium]
MSNHWDALIDQIAPDQPVLIAGCTASGKSALALDIAARQGGMIVNADALQVYDNWSVLTARPPAQDLAQAPHVLYGHVDRAVAYTVGDWLRDLRGVLGQARPIVVGGTGLFFRALTEGLADIPAIPPTIQAESQQMLNTQGLARMVADLDAQTRTALDVQNPMRVQRAWAVQRHTGRSIVDWQADTPAPDMPVPDCTALLLDADKDWLAQRIGQRFDLMIARGALDEVAANADDWDPTRLSSRAIGAPELMAFHQGDITLEQARTDAIIATRQYAKRQRTWFRKRMSDWTPIALPG